MSGYAVLDALYPFAGPCGFCGGPDKRHRLADALVEAHRAGDSIDLLVHAYDWPDVVTPESVRALADHAERNRKRRRARWSPIPVALQSQEAGE